LRDSTQHCDEARIQLCRGFVIQKYISPMRLGVTCSRVAFRFALAWQGNG
jgi:hypothetical protein